jgi:mannosyltransferase OCH1-like enzyme
MEGVMIKPCAVFAFLFSSFLFAAVSLPEGFGVPFSQGMSNFEWYRDSWTKTQPGWALAADLYTNYIINDLQYSDTPRIPKIIHQIWIGSPLPEKYLSLIASWQKYHPDWTYILWNDAMIEELDLVNKDQYEKSKNWGQKADIARYEILYRFGGLYVDIDFECFRSFDIFHHICDYYTGVGYAGRFSTFNGLIGSAAGNPILKECIDTLDIDAYYEGTPEHNILFTSGPFHQTRCFVSKAHEAGRAVAFPVNYFYPWPFSKKEEREYPSKWFRPETFAIHYWHASWREEKKTHRERSWQTAALAYHANSGCCQQQCTSAASTAAFFEDLWESFINSICPDDCYYPECDDYYYPDSCESR